MTYVRSLGQPVLHPEPDEEVIVGEVHPKRVDCAVLPPDSPWRRPGQVCEPTLWERFKELFLSGKTPTPAPTPEPESEPAPLPTPAGEDAWPFLLLAGGLGVGAYYLLKKRKK
jgi:hypothetical protein